MKNKLGSFSQLQAEHSSLILIAIILLLISVPKTDLTQSYSIEIEDSYNIGDAISVKGTAISNSSISIEVIDSKNSIKANAEIDVDSDGNYSITEIYVFKLSDEPGIWSVRIQDLISNETDEEFFEVIALWERFDSLEEDMSSLEANLNNLAQSLEYLSMIIYGSLAAIIVSTILSIVALTRYLQKREIYRKIVGKTSKKS